MPLLRLVHALERRRPGRAFSLGLTVRRPGVQGAQGSTVVASSRVGGNGPRAVVVGTGDRVDVAVGGNASPLPGGMSSQVSDGLLPRHLAILVVPLPNGTLLRAVSLHPDRGFAVLPVDAPLPGSDAVERLDAPTGSVVAWNALRVAFGGYVLDVVVDGPATASDVLEVLPAGQQLAFHAGVPLKAMGTAMSSIAGPAMDGAGGGGHAIPALVHTRDDDPIDGGLLLRARTGLVRVDVPIGDLMRGILVGRSRRCALGRGFDENDGLSRVHALVVGLDEPGAVGVFAFDLASRYGLRDVSRPSRLVPMARLDDGIGCLVYGAGYLTWESS
ncbi:MAG: hypothetical protein Q8O67_30050 [Deltaproteobacteria bacterium]|nr:hypothetical protein [Deltaproteobacteria bacterium]